MSPARKGAGGTWEDRVGARAQRWRPSPCGPELPGPPVRHQVWFLAAMLGFHDGGHTVGWDRGSPPSRQQALSLSSGGL